MSEVRVNNIVDYGGKGAPTFDNGAVISGVSSLGNQAKIGSNVTITSGGINVSGVTTATLSGNLTGDVSAGFLTATSTVIGSGVTINAGGLNITGVVTATTFEGSGASMTGVAMTITPLAYNPDVNDNIVPMGTGIGITFDHRILAGSGNITLSIATNAGAAGTTVENFGVGSSVTIQGRRASIDPTNDLDSSETYHISYPSGCFTNTSGDVSYVGTAYTFGVKTAENQLWIWGNNQNGSFGTNYITQRSSPVQLPGNDWTNHSGASPYNWSLFGKTNGTLWAAGYNSQGNLGQNNRTAYSSPVQIPGTTWDVNNFYAGSQTSLGRKTDGTLWTWGRNDRGSLGLNQANNTRYSSPVQIPGTNWASIGQGSYISGSAIKTDGTLWSWGYQAYGELGQNEQNTQYSSPVQIPGTNWASVKMAYYNTFAWKTDGTLWVWGENTNGELGLNNRTYSSPVQLPGTNWTAGIFSSSNASLVMKTDGTLWTMGSGLYGVTGQNNVTYYSSPVQIPGTNWKDAKATATNASAVKTDGTLWTWGTNQDHGLLGLNQAVPVKLSSPTQIGTDTDWDHLQENSNAQTIAAFKKI